MSTKLTLLFGTCAVLAMTAAAQAQTLTIATNGGSPAEAQAVTYDKSFTEKTGIAVVQDDGAYSELSKIRAQIDTGNLIWDMAVTVSVREATMCQEGLIEKIDWSQYLPADDFKAVGGFGACGAPYITSPGIIAYDTERYPNDTGPKSLADFWDVEKFPGMRGLVYQPDEIMELALMADGVPPEQVADVLITPEGLDRAFKKLEVLRPHIRWWKSGSESMQLLMNGETVMTYAYPGRVYNANKTDNRKFKIAWEAGFVSTPIYLVVVKGSPNKDAAIEYVKNALSPEQQAAYSDLTGQAPANIKAFDLLPKGGVLEEPKKYQDRGMVQVGPAYLNWYMDNGDMLAQRFAKFVGATE